LRSYARAGIPVYWVINLIELQVEVYTNPGSTALEPASADYQVFGVSGSVFIGDKPIGAVNVADIFP
jgi:hypothetical protein